MSWTIVVIAFFAVVVLAWHLTYTAARLDRLHTRVEGSLFALDAQLVRRAEASLEWANAGTLDAASAFLLASAATSSLELAEQTPVTHDVVEQGLPDDRLVAEEELGDVLAAVFDEPAVGDEAHILRTREASDRVGMALVFHNEAVRDVRRLRSNALVKVFHLAGHTVLPRELTLDVPR